MWKQLIYFNALTTCNTKQNLAQPLLATTLNGCTHAYTTDTTKKKQGGDLDK